MRFGTAEGPCFDNGSGRMAGINRTGLLRLQCDLDHPVPPLRKELIGVQSVCQRKGVGNQRGGVQLSRSDQSEDLSAAAGGTPPVL